MLKKVVNVKKKAVLGSIVHSVRFGVLELIENGMVTYNDSGVIEDVVDLNKTPLSTDYQSQFEQVHDCTGKLIIPGFVDAHCHAPQYVFTGSNMDLPLLQWLTKHTFPCEAKFSDVEFAKVAYAKSIQRHLKCGTTFASYFATIHNKAGRVLVDVINRVGQRAYVGKVSMDRNSPDFYIEETATGCEEAEDFVRYVLSMTTTGQSFLKSIGGEVHAEAVARISSDDAPEPLSTGSDTDRFSPLQCSSREDKSEECAFYAQPTLLNKAHTPLVMPCITPRFVPTCTPEIMAHLGALSLRYGLPVQSHLSESIGEIDWVSSLHPECKTYADVYDKYGLLHSAVFMAHCCHSSTEERALLSRRGAGAVHCASSNFMLSSGVMDVRQFLAEGIRVALGTDVAGGYSPSMLDAIRQCLIASRVKGFDHRSNVVPSTAAAAAADASATAASEDYRPLTYSEAFHLATVGGAEVLGMGDVVGNFVPGKKLDCLVVDVNAPNSPIDTFEGETVMDHFQKFLFLGDDRNIQHVFVDGVKVI